MTFHLGKWMLIDIILQVYQSVEAMISLRIKNQLIQFELQLTFTLPKSHLSQPEYFWIYQSLKDNNKKMMEDTL